LHQICNHYYHSFLHLRFSYSTFLQACTALSPDDQLRILQNKWNKNKMNAVMSKEDSETIKYYLNEVSVDV